MIYQNVDFEVDSMLDKSNLNLIEILKFQSLKKFWNLFLNIDKNKCFMSDYNRWLKGD